MILAGVATKIGLEALHAAPIATDVNSIVNFAPIGFGGAIGLSASHGVPKWLSGGAAQASVLGLYLAMPAAFGTSPQIWPLYGKLSAVLAGILLFQIFNGQQSRFTGVLESAPLRKIGRVSYGAYLIHHFVHFSAIGDFLQRFNVDIGAAPEVAEVLAEPGITLALAAVSWRYIERPIIAWAARLTSRGSSSSATRLRAAPAAASHAEGAITRN
jgi:peptidoglycan/LPS O-acetylase OafA/YrhL